MNTHPFPSILFCSLSFFFSSSLFASEGSKTDSLLKQLAIAKEDTNKVNLLNDISYLLLYNEPDKALIYAQQFLILSEKLKWKKGIAHSYHALGNSYKMLGDYEQAIFNYFKSIKTYEEINYKSGIGKAQVSIATIYGEMRNYEKKSELLESAIKIFAEIGDDKSLGKVYNNMGVNYIEQKDYTHALIYFDKALKIAERMQNFQSRSICYMNIGEVYFFLGNYDKALNYAKKGKEFAMQLNQKHQLAGFHVNIGKIYYKQAQYKEALHETLKGLSLANETKNKIFEKDAYYSLSEIYSGMGNHLQALENYKLYESVKDSLSNEQTAKNIAELEAKEKNEKSQQKIDLLKKENEIQTLKLESKNYLIGGLILIFCLMIFTGVLFVRQIRFKEHKKVMLQEQKALLQEQKALRAQINPHFFANTLNSIQKLIPKGAGDNAQDYIVKFSALMRTVLNNSDQIFVAIDDELSAVKLYMEMEQLRVDNQFEFEINVDPNVDIYHNTMPSMVIQPYVENAIWHGLIGKIKKGKVSISITQKEDIISLTLEDNGAGRSNPENNKNHSAQKPSGMKLVQDRIHTINLLRKTNFKVSITDLFDDADLPCGTRVGFEIPVLS